jgi:mycoredoxin
MSIFDIGRPVRSRARRDRSGGNPPEVVVYWRPGCPYCARLRAHLWARGLRPRMRNIWADPAAAAFVRSVTGGTETVPTVVIGDVAHVNPRPRMVVAALRDRQGVPR